MKCKPNLQYHRYFNAIAEFSRHDVAQTFHLKIDVFGRNAHRTLGHNSTYPSRNRFTRHHHAIWTNDSTIEHCTYRYRQRQHQNTRIHLIPLEKRRDHYITSSLRSSPLFSTFSIAVRVESSMAAYWLANSRLGGGVCAQRSEHIAAAAKAYARNAVST